MRIFEFGNKRFEVDDEGFLMDPAQWDEVFAEGTAPAVGISGGLSRAHWKVIHFVRNSLSKTGRCPMIYEVCKEHSFRLSDLKALFPTGYLRGVCRLAGLTYRERAIDNSLLPGTKMANVSTPIVERVYHVDILGFLIDPENWDEEYAVCKSEEMKMPVGLTQEHWKIVHFLRKRFRMDGVVPTVYETCEANQMKIEDLERLFPDGYHRGAVKIAGLRVR